LVLKNRIEKLLEDYDDILVLTYNRFMKAWLQAQIEAKYRSKNIYCETFHKWAWDNFKYQYEWDDKLQTRRNIVRLVRQTKIKYQAILVDEAQDFYDEWFEAISAVLDPKTEALFIVYDNTQSIYGQSERCKPDWSWKNLGINIAGGRSQVLDLNYRNSPEILELAWQFIEPVLIEAEMKIERRERDEQGRVIKTPKIGSIIEPRKKLDRSCGIKPLLLQVDYEDMPSKIAYEVQAALNGYEQSSIGILVHPQAADLKQEISEELQQLDIAHCAPISSGDRAQNIVSRPGIIVDSWNALKGVEFDAVIVAGVDSLSIYDQSDFAAYAGLYIAMTRAKDHLVMLYENQDEVVEKIQFGLNASDQLIGA
jgi:superfamily I DNA/RNA helicase